MRELSISDLSLVGGGDYSAGDMMAVGAGLGGGIGASLAASFGLTAAEGLTLAGIGSAFGAGVTAAAIGGWALGEGLNQHTPIQKWIAGMVDSINTMINSRVDTSTLDGDE